MIRSDLMTHSDALPTELTWQALIVKWSLVSKELSKI